jgi:hypothetical protein
MYNEMIYTSDELKRDLEWADRKAAYGWRVWMMQSRESRWLDAALAALGRTLIAAGQRLVAARGEATLRGKATTGGEAAAPGPLGLTGAA